MAVSATLFALMNFFARLASSTASWATVGAVRAVVGAIVAASVARLRGAPLGAKDRKAVFWRSVFGTGAMLSTFYALSSRTLGLGDTVTLLNLTPAFLAVLAPVVLRERTTIATMVAIAISLGGVILVVHPTFLFGGGAVAPAHMTGPSAGATAAVAVLAAGFTSIAMMLLRRVGQTEGAEAIAFQFSVFAAATFTLFSLFDLRLPHGRAVIHVIAAGVCAGFGQLAMTRAYALAQAARVSAMSYLAIVASAVLGAVVLREQPTFTAMAGMALVIGGGLVITFTRESS